MRRFIGPLAGGALAGLLAWLFDLPEEVMWLIVIGCGLWGGMIGVWLMVEEDE